MITYVPRKVETIPAPAPPVQTDSSFWDTTRDSVSAEDFLVEAVEFELSSVEDSVESFLSKNITGLKGVESIYMRGDKDFLRIWVVIDNPSDEVEDPIYAKYLDMLGSLAGLETDFSVIYRCGRELDSLLPSGAHRVN